MPQLNDLIGKPFKDGGRGPDAYDCYGLAIEVFKRYGIDLPDFKIACRDTKAINGRYLEQKPFWKDVTEEKPAPSLIFMRFNSSIGNHVGVYLGQGRFIHARASTLSCIERINSPVWATAVIGYYVPAGKSQEVANGQSNS